MVNFDFFKTLALSFPEATEEPHFEKTSFRIRKKIFATYDVQTNRACIKLNEIDQNVFTLAGKTKIYPLENKWGKQGWTMIEMETIDQKLFTDALTAAYCNVAPKKLHKIILSNQSLQLSQENS